MRHLRNGIWTIAIAYWVFLFVMTHIPQVPMPHLPNIDKSAHLVAYFVLGCLLGAAMWISNPARKYIALWVLAIGVVYGAFDELTQPLVNRYCEYADWVADVIGTSVAAGLIVVLRLVRGAAGAPLNLPPPPDGLTDRG